MTFKSTETPFAIFHIPHSSMEIPPGVRKNLVLTEKELEEELLKMTDRYTDELFNLDSRVARQVVFQYSRLVVDPERFLDDDKESMAKMGMGVVYSRTSDGGILRKYVSEEERSSLIESYYIPHHNTVGKAIHEVLENWGKCLIIDCHSFPSSPLPYEPDQLLDRPDICIGTDGFHTPEWLSNLAVTLFREENLQVSTNQPYSGAFVPDKYNRKNDAVWALMIELNRSLYMDEPSGDKIFGFEVFKTRLLTVLQTLIEEAKKH